MCVLHGRPCHVPLSNVLRLNFATQDRYVATLSISTTHRNDTQQVLHLWDRIIAYDDLTLVAVLAAAIFTFRSKAVGWRRVMFAT